MMENINWLLILFILSMWIIFFDWFISGKRSLIKSITKLILSYILAVPLGLFLGTVLVPITSFFKINPFGTGLQGITFYPFAWLAGAIVSFFLVFLWLYGVINNLKERAFVWIAILFLFVLSVLYLNALSSWFNL